MTQLLVETDAHEGPVYVAADQALYFTTQRAGRRVDIMRLSLPDGRVSAVLADAGAANGMALDHDGRLLVCEQQPAAISRVDPATGARETVVDAYRGLPLNSPNDVVVKSDGSIGFTDPSYAYLQGFGPDESVLYVGNSEACVIDAFDVLHGRVLANRRRFATITRGFPDGLKTDRRGNVYTTGGPGLLVFSPTGALLREIDLPGAVNFAFAGDRLLVTAHDAIWSIPLQGA